MAGDVLFLSCARQPWDLFIDLSHQRLLLLLYFLILTVPLTQTAKKTREHKSAIIQDVRDAIDSYENLYLFSYENMRSSKFKNVRMHFTGSRIFMGKNKLLQIALGRTSEEEYGDNLREVAKLTSGSVGLLFTSEPRKEVESYFYNLAEDDFARAGAVAPRKVVVTQDMVATHPVSMVEQFRKLGLPVEVDNGRVAFVGGKTEHTLCKDGETLSAETCKALTHFGIKLAEFRVRLICRWSAKDGEFEMLE
jgi:mRNA turnover protein 4